MLMLVLPIDPDWSKYARWRKMMPANCSRSKIPHICRQLSRFFQGSKAKCCGSCSNSERCSTQPRHSEQQSFLVRNIAVSRIQNCHDLCQSTTNNMTWSVGNSSWSLMYSLKKPTLVDLSSIEARRTTYDWTHSDTTVLRISAILVATTEPRY